MKRLGAIISKIEDGSIAQELELSCGDELLSINSTVPNDIMEYSFQAQDEEITIEVKHKDGEIEIIEIEKDYGEDLGISFETAVFDHIKPCQNNCLFCFVDGQPDNLRKSLYVKDDDWRLSYFQGTYITMTNLKAKDWEQKAFRRPSPLFVSVQTTNPELRAKMMRNPNASKILENLDRLTSLDIDFHAQVVLCPTYNDKEELQRTLDDLKKYKKHLKSLAIVPVGISKYHKNQLPELSKEDALDIIKRVEKFNSDLKKNIAMASDEVFLKAQYQIPEKKYYGSFPQIEDGIGAIRKYLDDFEKNKKKLIKKTKKLTKLGIITGEISKFIFDGIKNEINIEGLDLSIIEVKNKFFGDRISVTGLICAQDIIRTLKEMKTYPEIISIPSVMLKEGTEEFLDSLTVSDIEQELGVKIHIVKDFYSFMELKDLINSF